MVIASALCILVVGARGLSESPRSDQRQHIDARDLPGKVAIRGRLGIPLGTVVRLRGTWRETDPRKSKHQYRYLTIEQREGGDLNEPITFGEWDVDNWDLLVPTMPQVGQRWDVDAFETGEFAGVPQTYFDKLGLDIPLRGGVGRINDDRAPFHFRTRLVYLRCTVEAE
jgi:hypothetical protein